MTPRQLRDSANRPWGETGRSGTTTGSSPEKCRDCVYTEKKFPGYGYRCRKFPKCGYPHHPGGCRCGCKTP